MQCHNIYLHLELHTFLAMILYCIQSCPLTPNILIGVKENSRVKMPPHAPWHSCVLMLHSFTTRARLILALLSWNMPEPSGKKKIHWWDNLVIQYIQELCWLAVPRPDQLKQPQIITLQFSGLNRNDDGQCISAVMNGFKIVPVCEYMNELPCH